MDIPLPNDQAEKSASQTNSLMESIDVYVPSESDPYSPISRESPLSPKYYESVLICKDIDIDKEFHKINEGSDGDSFFKILSMSFYDRRDTYKSVDTLSYNNSPRKSEESGRTFLSVRRCDMWNEEMTPQGKYLSPEKIAEIKNNKLRQILFVRSNSEDDTKLISTKERQPVPNLPNLYRLSMMKVGSKKNIATSSKPKKPHQNALYNNTKFMYYQNIINKRKASLNKEFDTPEKLETPKSKCAALKTSNISKDNPPTLQTKNDLPKTASTVDTSRPMVTESNNRISPRAGFKPYNFTKKVALASNTKPLKEQIEKILLTKISNKKKLIKENPNKADPVKDGLSNKNTPRSILSSKRSTVDQINYFPSPRNLEEKRENQVNYIPSPSQIEEKRETRILQESLKKPNENKPIKKENTPKTKIPQNTPQLSKKNTLEDIKKEIDKQNFFFTPNKHLTPRENHPVSIIGIKLLRK